MAKELPYFQFEPAEYLTKDISFCSLSAQGLFSNICSYYWQRGCKLTKDQILRRLNYEDELNELINEGVIDLMGEDIHIKFLYYQYQKATEFSDEQTRKGKLGGAKKGNQNASKTTQKQTENNPKTSHKIIEDNIIEDKIIEELIPTTEKIKKIDVVYSLFVKEIKEGYHTQWAEQTYMQLGLKKGSLTTLINNFKSHLIRSDKFHETVSDFKDHLNNWLNNLDSIGKLNEYKTKSIGSL